MGRSRWGGPGQPGPPLITSSGSYLPMYPRYVFKGLVPFVEDAANVLGVVPHSISVAKVQSLWHIKRLQDALGQAKLDYTQAQLRETMAYIGDVRHGLAVALGAADAA